MKKVLRYGAIAIGVIIVLAMIVPFLVPTDTYKKLIVNEAGKRISGKIEIGSMRIKILPLPGFTLKDVKLSNTTGTFSGQTIVAAKEISGNVKLMPLLSRSAIVSLSLLSPEVYYSTGKNGKTNIDDLLVAPVATGSVAPTFRSGDSMTRSKDRGYIISNAFAEDAKKPEPAKPASSEWKVMVTGLEIKDGLA